MTIKDPTIKKLIEVTGDLDYIYQEGSIFNNDEANTMDNISKQLHEMAIDILNDNYRRTAKYRKQQV